MSFDNSAISNMLNRGVSDQEDRIKNDIKETNALLTQNEIRNLEVRLVRRGIIYQQMSMSELSMIWAPHLYSKQTGQSLAIRVDIALSQLKESGLESLYSAMRDECRSFDSRPLRLTLPPDSAMRARAICRRSILPHRRTSEVHRLILDSAGATHGASHLADAGCRTPKAAGRRRPGR